MQQTLLSSHKSYKFIILHHAFYVLFDKDLQLKPKSGGTSPYTDHFKMRETDM